MFSLNSLNLMTKIVITVKGFEPQPHLVFETSMLPPQRQPDTCEGQDL